MKLLRSLSTTGLSTLAFKKLFADQRPNGAKGGYPSGHTSMSVTAASSLWYSYGAKVGGPAMILASLVALQRLDSRAHEMGDVIGGAVLGWVVARSLERRGAARAVRRARPTRHEPERRPWHLAAVELLNQGLVGLFGNLSDWSPFWMRMVSILARLGTAVLAL